MRALVQRVLEAAVTVDDDQVSAIGKGLLVFIGIGKGDTEDNVLWLADKIASLRIFEDSAGKMNLSLLETTRQALVVSQFTLYGDTRKGRRPSFTAAEEPQRAQWLYERACKELQRLGLEVRTGVFAADMKVSLINDGPVTLWIDSGDALSP